MVAPNLHTVLRFWATRWPNRVAIKDAEKEISWGALDRRSDEIAAGLAARGLRKGDRVGILMRNRIEFLEILHATLKVGGALTLLNTRFTPKEMVYPVVDADLKIVFTEEKYVNLLAEAAREVSLRVVTTDPVDGCETLDELRLNGGHAPALQVDAHDVALVCYTSGTTGLAKGAMLTHHNLVASGIARVIPAGMNFNDKVLLSLPLAYTGGLTIYLRDALVPGATSVIPSSFDAGELMEVIQRERITAWSSVATITEAIANHPRFQSTDFTSLRHTITGGQPVSRHLLYAWQSVGVSITQAYGLTESGGSHATLLFSEEAERKLGFAGRPLLGIGLRIVDDEGRDLPAGETGEIWLSGDTIMKGYLNKPEETAKALEGGWLHTGDMGLVDEEGFLKLVDRKKDMLISGGLNVYPAELERTLAGISGMEEFVIIGVKDDRWGEVPMIVAYGTGPLDVNALKEKCRQDLADYKRPHYFLNYGRPLPRTFSEKLLKRALRDQFWEVPETALRLKD
jgi:fatty-acyl-CoA synthase